MNSETENGRTAYDVESKVEGFHWWFVGRRKLIGSLLSSIKLPKNCLALDLGCGTGANLKAIKSAGLYGIGLDRSTYALNLLKLKGTFPILSGDLNNLPIKTKSISLIIAMDVFEHLEFDEDGMSECYRVLNKGGIMFLTVPAFRSLWGAQDDVTGHKRRYRMKDIKEKLRQQGFDIQRSSFFNIFLFFPILLARRIIGFLDLRIESENKINHPFINNILKGIFSLEPYLLKYISFPFGVSIFCVARKD